MIMVRLECGVLSVAQVTAGVPLGKAAWIEIPCVTIGLSQ